MMVKKMIILNKMSGVKMDGKVFKMIKVKFSLISLRIGLIRKIVLMGSRISKDGVRVVIRDKLVIILKQIGVRENNRTV